jgi:hypothetical protein
MESKGRSGNPLEPRHALQLWAAALTVGLGAVGCGATTDECISLPDTCSPVLSTDYNTLYQDVFSKRCGTANGGMSCHGGLSSQGGLSLADSNAAYNALLGNGSHARVIPGNPECSPLMARLTSSDPNVRMPKGEAALGAGVICAVQIWIREGAR